jgi:hypothetical protein
MVQYHNLKKLYFQEIFAQVLSKQYRLQRELELL